MSLAVVSSSFADCRQDTRVRITTASTTSAGIRSMVAGKPSCVTKTTTSGLSEPNARRRYWHSAMPNVAPVVS